MNLLKHIHLKKVMSSNCLPAQFMIASRNGIYKSLWSKSDQEPINNLDLVFNCVDGSIAAHKFILKTASPVIESSLTGIAVILDDLLTIVLPNVSVTIVQMVLKIIYTGKATVYNQDDLEEVWNLACKELKVNMVSNVNSFIELQKAQSEQPQLAIIPFSSKGIVSRQVCDVNYPKDPTNVLKDSEVASLKKVWSLPQYPEIKQTVKHSNPSNGSVVEDSNASDIDENLDYEKIDVTTSLFTSEISPLHDPTNYSNGISNSDTDSWSDSGFQVTSDEITTNNDENRGVEDYFSIEELLDTDIDIIKQEVFTDVERQQLQAKMEPKTMSDSLMHHEKEPEEIFLEEVEEVTIIETIIHHSKDSKPRPKRFHESSTSKQKNINTINEGPIKREKNICQTKKQSRNSANEKNNSGKEEENTNKSKHVDANQKNTLKNLASMPFDTSISESVKRRRIDPLLNKDTSRVKPNPFTKDTDKAQNEKQLQSEYKPYKDMVMVAFEQLGSAASEKDIVNFIIKRYKIQKSFEAVKSLVNNLIDKIGKTNLISQSKVSKTAKKDSSSNIPSSNNGNFPLAKVSDCETSENNLINEEINDSLSANGKSVTFTRNRTFSVSHSRNKEQQSQVKKSSITTRSATSQNEMKGLEGDKRYSTRISFQQDRITQEQNGKQITIEKSITRRVITRNAAIKARKSFQELNTSAKTVSRIKSKPLKALTFSGDKQLNCKCGETMISTTGQKRIVVAGNKRRVRCNECKACNTPSCGHCKFCKNPKWKKPCENRICTTPLLPNCPCFQ